MTCERFVILHDEVIPASERLQRTVLQPVASVPFSPWDTAGLGFFRDRPIIHSLNDFQTHDPMFKMIADDPLHFLR
jgi:hypothetical protein